MPPNFNISTRKILKATAVDYQSIPDKKEDKEVQTDRNALRMVRELVLYERAYMLMQDDDSEEMVKRIQQDVDAARVQHQARTNSTMTSVQSRKDPVPFKDAKEHLTSKDACLRKMRNLWVDLSDSKQDDNEIRAALNLGGSKPADFLRSVLVRIDNPVWMKNRWWQWKQWDRVKVMPGDLPNAVHDSSGSKEIPEILQKILPESFPTRTFFSRCFSFFINTSHKVEYEVYWCGVKGMFDERGNNPTRYMMILGELEKADPEVFETVMAQTIVRHHWNLVFYWGFCLDRVLDVISLCLLYLVSADLHVEKLPRWSPVYGLCLLSFWGCLKTFASLIQCYVMYKSLELTRTFWNFIFLSIELITFMVFQGLAMESYSPFHHGMDATRVRSDDERLADFQTSLFKQHPLAIPFIVSGRWLYLLLGLLNLEIIGQSILPVWEAARSRQSLVFLAYLFLGTVACTHSYYTFPIDDVGDFVMAFFRTMRLTFLGDFDMFELMGVDDGIMIRNASLLKAAVDGDNWTEAEDVGSFAGIDEDEQNPTYMKGIRAWALMWAFIGPVIFMNIYIGLLGSAYEQAKEHIGALFAKFRISTLTMLLLRRHFFEQNPFTTMVKLFKVVALNQDPPTYVELDGREGFKGYWIAIPRNLTGARDDVDDLSEKIDEASHEGKENYEALKADIKELTELVKSLADRDKARID